MLVEIELRRRRRAAEALVSELAEAVALVEQATDAPDVVATWALRQRCKRLYVVSGGSWCPWIADVERACGTIRLPDDPSVGAA